MTKPECKVLPERAFRRDRRALGDVGLLLADAFLDADDIADRAQLAREAHWGDAPTARICHRDEAGRVVGHVALFEIDHDASSPHRVIGIGDLVVHPGHRGQGLGRMLIERAVDLARGAHHADVIFVRSTALPRVWADQGFKPTRCGALSPKPGWLAWSRRGRLPRLGWLDPNDV